MAETDTGLRLRPPPPPVSAKPKSGLRHWLLVGGMGLGGAAVGFLSARLGVDLLLPTPHKGWLLLLLALLPLAWLVVVGWHEFGHIVGGWLTGGRFLIWVVGPFMIRRSPAGLKAGWNRSVNLAGGMAACLPLEPGAVTPRRMAVMVLGGPLASLVLFVAALWLSAGLADVPGFVPLGRTLAQQAAVVTAFLSLLIFLVTAYPGEAGGFKTDGRRVFDLLRGDRRSDQEAAVMILTTAGMAGLRPADYDPALVARAVALGDGSLFDLYGRATVYYHAADRQDWRAAQDHLDCVLTGEERMVPYLRDVVRCEYAWLLATAGGPDAAPLARAWLETAGPLDFDPATRLRAEAAVLRAEGRRDESIAKAREGLHALDHRSLSPVRSPFAADALAALAAGSPL